jgi:hypothetical protein
MKLLLPLLLVAAAQSSAIEFEPWSFTERDLFPSAIISTATVDWNGDENSAEDKKTEDDPAPRKKEIPIYGDENGWLAVALFDVPAGAEVTVTIEVEGYMKPSKWTGVIERKRKEVRIFPKGKWDYAALHKVKQQKPVTATFNVTVDGEALEEQSETCVLKSMNDCPFYVLWDEDGEEFDDFSWVFAAYVNENHPEIDGILKEALDSGLIDSFTGYQSGNPDEVVAQVFAIWNVLQRRGIKYSDVSTTTPSKFVVSQTVRFVEDTIHATQANCVDGSVLMASVLRKIGIDSHLVMVPGHCFLAFRLTNEEVEFEDMFAEDSDLLGLETTMLGQDKLKPTQELVKLPEKMKAKQFEASFKTFNSALETGTGSLMEHADAMISGENPNIQLISIKEARELGIMPIAAGEK